MKTGTGLVISYCSLWHEKDSIVLNPGQQLDVALDYRLHAPWNVPKADSHIIIGIEEVPQYLHIIGTPGEFPGIGGSLHCTLPAPSAPGEYTIYAAKIDKSDVVEDVVFREYRDTFQARERYHFHIPLGTIVVRDRTARFEGTVTDNTGAPVEGAIISAVSLDDEQIFTSQSDDQGVYDLSVLPGSYSIAIERAESMSWAMYQDDSVRQLREGESLSHDLVWRAEQALLFHDINSLTLDRSTTLAPAETYSFRAQFTTLNTRQQEPGKEFIIIGVGDDPYDAVIIEYADAEIEYSGTASFTIRTPDVPGTYTVRGRLIRANTVTAAFDRFQTEAPRVPFRYIELGRIQVVPW
ncbi:carboxypeptidase-like regulatory domain-containing protein [Gemmatimonadota bacterium]